MFFTCTCRLYKLCCSCTRLVGEVRCFIYRYFLDLHERRRSRDRGASAKEGVHFFHAIVGQKIFVDGRVAGLESTN